MKTADVIARAITKRVLVVDTEAPYVAVTGVSESANLAMIIARPAFDSLLAC